MPIETPEGWKCSICGEIRQNKKYADYCEESHDTIYVKFNREDLFRLIQFVYTGDRSLLTRSLVQTLSKFKSGSYTNSSKSENVSKRTR